VWPYVIVGSAIGGAVGYFLMTEAGRKVGRSLTHPDELSNNLQDARDFVQTKVRLVTDQVHRVLDKAKQGIEEGERGYHEAEQSFQSQVRQLGGKNDEIAATVHQTVDTVSRTASTIEQSVLDPICELGALYKGVERGIRAVIGKKDDETVPSSAPASGPIPIYPDNRMMGS